MAQGYGIDKSSSLNEIMLFCIHGVFLLLTNYKYVSFNESS